MKLFEVNAVGPFLVTKAFLPNLKLAVAKRGSATVAQISSQRGSIAQNDTGGKYGYRTSKAALNMLNTSLAIDLRSDKITTLALHPGYVVTRMTGHKGEVTPDESVAGLTKVITNAKPVDSGKYLDFLGNSLPWKHVHYLQILLFLELLVHHFRYVDVSLPAVGPQDTPVDSAATEQCTERGKHGHKARTPRSRRPARSPLWTCSRPDK
ncbi:hypothetical protein ON010_g8556 [Phytophthora cinnamomi]|nr:hypothetical protein ON010_g8556 [Phytophthora cinnamomi]